MLPRVDGFEVCRQVRASSSVPIIMLTASAEEIDKVLGLELGADDYITKPFSVREFRSRVKAVLRRAELTARRDAEEPHRGRRPADRLREAQRDPLAGGGRALTYVEFEILAALARNPGRVYNRMVLLERVWGDASYRDPRTVDVHIRHLREKLERDPKRARADPHGARASATASGIDEAVHARGCGSLRNKLALLSSARSPRRALSRSSLLRRPAAGVQTSRAAKLDDLPARGPGSSESDARGADGQPRRHRPRARRSGFARWPTRPGARSRCSACSGRAARAGRADAADLRFYVITDSREERDAPQNDPLAARAVEVTRGLARGRGQRWTASALGELRSR